MEELLNQLISSFNVVLLFSLITTTYLVLKLMDAYVFTNQVFRHVATMITCAILCYVYYKYDSITLKEIIPTYLLSTAFYDIIIKKVLDKLNIAYTKLP